MYAGLFRGTLGLGLCYLPSQAQPPKLNPMGEFDEHKGSYRLTTHSVSTWQVHNLHPHRYQTPTTVSIN